MMTMITSSHIARSDSIGIMTSVPCTARMDDRFCLILNLEGYTAAAVPAQQG